MSLIKRLAVALTVLAAGVTLSMAALPTSAAQAPTAGSAGARAADGVRAAGGFASDGTRTLAASRVSGLDPSGSIVTVSGSGYDESKGIYLAVCVDNGPDAVSTPCIGGVDMSGGSGSSVWISSNPPPYGEGLAKPYGKGGTFSVALAVAAEDPITGTDCRVTACAVVTRNDHTRPHDRSQDLRVPISFAAGPRTSTKPAPTSQGASTSKAAPTSNTAQTSKASVTGRPVTSAPARPTSADAAPATSSKQVAPPVASTVTPSTKPVTRTLVPATPNSPPPSSSGSGPDASPATPAVTGNETSTAVTDPPESPAAPQRSPTMTSADGESFATATASDGTGGTDGADDVANRSSSTAQPAPTPVRTDAVEPTASTVDDSSFPVLLVVGALVVAASGAGGFLFYRRQHR